MSDLVPPAEGGVGGRVRVLDEDPELAARLGAEQAELAARVLVAPTRRVGVGSWSAAEPDSAVEAGTLGLLVPEGIAAVELGARGRAHLELLGPGDVMRPWMELEPEATVPSVVEGRVLSPVRIALLDRRFALSGARWPEITAALLSRMVLRVRRLSFQLAVVSLPRIEDRLETMLWHFADRWGRVRPDGVVLTLPLTHALLAQVVAARRPSVTTALGALERQGRIERHGNEWLLHGPPPAALAPLERETALGL